MSIIVKYKFDKTIYADLLPEFNAEFTSDKYNTTDEEVDGIITRTIESDELPTLMRFGRLWVSGESASDNRTDSLLEVLTMNTSGLTDCHSMFRYNTNLTSIDCEWDTSNVTRISNMFAYCTNLTSLDVSNFNTSKVADMSSMFYGCTNLTSLDVSNFNTSNVTDMNNMFYNCQSLTSLDVSNFDTSNVTLMSNMFYGCHKLTSLDVSNFDTSKVTDMQSMFYNCNKLTSLNVSNFNTSNVTNIGHMFNNCNNLTSLDISNFDTSKVTDTTNMFNNTLLLTDIGMLYCKQSTIETIASVLPTDITQTVWVEDVDVKDLTPVKGVEFKQYAKDTEIMLTSPLLEGDKLIVKDGKLYHYHKMGMVVLDGSEDWKINNHWVSSSYRRFHLIFNTNGNWSLLKSDKLKTIVFDGNMDNQFTECISCYDTGTEIIIQKNNILTLDGFKQWLQANPTTVVYGLASPYYELISEDPLTISLIAESSDITNSSNIPLNMTINNKGLSTVAMSPSTTYTVAFDKDTDSEVVVNLCGNEITTTNNVVEITTPSEINDELIFYGDGVEVSNVRLLEGSVSGDSIPRESFEGLKSSFEDGYIPENLVTKLGIIPDTSQGNGITILGDNYTFPGRNLAVMFSHSNFSKPHTFVVIPSNDSETQQYTVHSMANGNVQVYQYVRGFNTLLFNQPADRYRMYTEEESANSSFRILILEGDWTHLTEEDFNHLGKYKVEYKVTGKNKFDINKCNITNGVRNGNSMEFTSTAIYNTGGSYNAPLNTFTSGKKYTMSMTLVKHVSDPNYSPFFQVQFLKDNVAIGDYRAVNGNKANFTCPNGFDTVRIVISNGYYTGAFTVSDVQIEEGEVKTTYEPYKEYTKTYYLNSPLLEGDTIEDIHGVATHVKRYEKVVLDGSEDWKQDNYQLMDGYYAYYETNSPLGYSCDKWVCDKFICDSKNSIHNYDFIAQSGNGNIEIITTKTMEEWRQWLLKNPTTVIKLLKTPIYEPISNESILCDSYVNGHLDVDTNIPIEKVQFDLVTLSVKYYNGIKNHILQFESDSEGVLTVTCGGRGTNIYNSKVIKGLNKFNIDNLIEGVIGNIRFNGIGFNASNIQVVATDRDANFGYFKGLQSSFENNVENLNLWDGTLVKGEYISTNYTYIKDASKARSACIKCRPNTTYIITATNNDRLRIGHVSELVGGSPCMVSDIDDTNISYKEFTTAHREGYLIVYVANDKNTNENITVDIREKANKVKCKVVGKNKFNSELELGDLNGYTGVEQNSSTRYRSKFISVIPNTQYTITHSNSNTKINTVYEYDKNKNFIQYVNTYPSYTSSNETYYIRFKTDLMTDNIQLEEGTQATPYEPYQEYTKTIYLNSPLLKGDTIEVHNGKLCHYHKMGMVVLDGTLSIKNIAFSPTNTNGSRYWIPIPILTETVKNNTDNLSYNDRFPSVLTNDDDREELIVAYENQVVFLASTSKNFTQTSDVVKFFEQNPTTVVYELAEPWYEEITPTQEDLIITSVKEGDLHIDTIVPVSSKVTYNVNVQLLTDFEQSIVEQVQATQTTDLQSILDEEIDN